MTVITNRGNKQMIITAIHSYITNQYRNEAHKQQLKGYNEHLKVCLKKYCMLF